MTENRDLILWLYEALGQPIGILLNSDDPYRLAERLRAQRTKQDDDALAILQFRVVDLPDGNLAIVKTAGTLSISDLGI